MANTSARPEQAFDQVDHKAPKSDGGAVSAAQAAYQPGTKMEFKAQKLSDGTLEFTPLFNPPESSSNAMGKGPDKSGFAPYEALNLPIKPNINDAQPNSNAMRGSDKDLDKSGWGPYEALDLPIKQKNSNAMRSSEAPTPDEDVRSAKKIEKLLHGAASASPDEDVKPAKKVEKLLDHK